MTIIMTTFEPSPDVGKLTSGPPAKVKAAMTAMMGMKKIDIAVMRRAYDEA